MRLHTLEKRALSLVTRHYGRILIRVLNEQIYETSITIDVIRQRRYSWVAYWPILRRAERRRQGLPSSRVVQPQLQGCRVCIVKNKYWNYVKNRDHKRRPRQDYRILIEPIRCRNEKTSCGTLILKTAENKSQDCELQKEKNTFQSWLMFESIGYLRTN